MVRLLWNLWSYVYGWVNLPAPGCGILPQLRWTVIHTLYNPCSIIPSWIDNSCDEPSIRAAGSEEKEDLVLRSAPRLEGKKKRRDYLMLTIDKSELECKLLHVYSGICDRRSALIQTRSCGIVSEYDMHRSFRLIGLILQQQARVLSSFPRFSWFFSCEIISYSSYSACQFDS